MSRRTLTCITLMTDERGSQTAGELTYTVCYGNDSREMNMISFTERLTLSIVVMYLSVCACR